MITTMKYRLKPTKTQVAVMYRTLDVCRETYNLSLETKVVAYENSKVHLSNFELPGMYTHAEIGKGVVHSLVIFDVAPSCSGAERLVDPSACLSLLWIRLRQRCQRWV